MHLASKKILVVGASSDFAIPLNKALYISGITLGLHFNKNKKSLSKFKQSKIIKKFQKNLDSSHACHELIDDFVSWAGGIDCLIQLSGDIKGPIHWENLTEKQWHYDLSINLIMPFFLAQRAIYHMRNSGGRIILMSTASASHGGGTTSLAYGAAKSGVECIVKRLAKDCAKHNILVNAIAPGFILTKFHTERMKRTPEQLQKRAEMVPLKRAGTTEEIAAAIIYLLSEGSSYITGQVLAVSGGDWL